MAERDLNDPNPNDDYELDLDAPAGGAGAPDPDGEEGEEEGEPAAPDANAPAPDGEADPDGEEEELSFEIEGEEAPRESNVMRELREANRRQARELAQLKAQQQGNQPAPELGKKPDLWEDCDGDAEVFERELTSWYSRKQEADARAKQAEQAAEQAAAEWGKVEQGYNAKVAALGAPKFQEYEQRVLDALHPDMVKAVKFYMTDPAKVMAALGSNPALLERISKEQDPIKALFHLRDVEGKINVKRKPPSPEAGTIQRSTAPVTAAGADKQLARLEAQADKTGDRTALIAYKRQLKARGK